MAAAAIIVPSSCSPIVLECAVVNSTSDKPYFVIYHLFCVCVWRFKRNSLFMVPLVYRGTHGCERAREGGVKIKLLGAKDKWVRLSRKKRRKRRRKCVQKWSRALCFMWLNVLFHFPNPGLSVSPSVGALQPTATWKACLCEATPPPPNSLDASWMQRFHVVRYIFKLLGLCALGHRVLSVERGVHQAMKTLPPFCCCFFLFSGLCCWWFGPQMLPLRNPRTRLADVSHSKALVSSVSAFSIPAWWDVKSCRHGVSKSEQVCELTVVIIFDHVWCFRKGQRWQLGIIRIHL